MKKLLLLFIVLTYTVSINAQANYTTHLSGKNITCITVGANNTVWAGTNKQGLWVFQNGNWSSVPGGTGAVNPSTTAINFNDVIFTDLATDANGGVWAAQGGTGANGFFPNGGVEHFPNGPSSFNHYQMGNSGGLGSRNVRGVEVDKTTNTVYVACGQMSFYSSGTGVWTYSAFEYYTFNGGKTWNTRYIPTYWSDPSYNTYLGGVFSMPVGGSQFTVMNSSFIYGGIENTSDVQIMRSVGAKNGEVVASKVIDNKIYRFVNGAIQTHYTGYNPPASATNATFPLPPTIVGLGMASHFDHNNHLWLGFNQGKGFAVRKNNVWYYAPTMALCNGASVSENAIASDSTGRVYIGTNKGLIVYKGYGNPNNPGSYRTYNVGNSCLPSNTIKGVATDKNGYLWIATDNGVIQTQITNFTLEVSNIKSTTSPISNYGSRHLLVATNADCLPSNPTTALIKVAADGTKSTVFKFTDGNTLNKKLRIVNAGSEDKFGKLISLDISADSLVYLYQHPEFKDNTTPNDITFELIDSTTQVKVLSFKVDIKRPPVLLLHGLNSSGPAMYNIRDRLVTTSNNYNTFQIAIPSYDSCGTFSSNIPTIMNVKNTLKETCLNNNLSFGKIDFVGHSMGGILSRLYLQNANYQHDMHKIITINTPHSGSQLGGIGNSLINLYNGLVFVTKVFVKNRIIKNALQYIQCDAVGNLDVNDPAIRVLLNGTTLNINKAPSHVITSTKPHTSYMTGPNSPNVPVSLFELEMGYYTEINSNHLLIPNIINDFFNGEESDIVVPISSQLGGLTGNAVTSCQNFSTPNCDLTHTEVHHNPIVCNRIDYLLAQSAKSNLFETNGFNPTMALQPLVKDNRHITQKVIAKNRAASTINFITPTIGGTYSSGTILNISIAGSSNITKTLLGIIPETKDSIWQSIKLSPNNTYQYNIPPNLNGRINAVVFAYDSTGFTAIDTFYFFASTSVLPITLTQFEGKATKMGNNLTWTTSSESNTKHFDIERSSDGQIWKSQGIVKAAGNSNITQRYDFLDKNPSDKAYYRLRSVDNDGRTELSNVIYLSNSKEYEIDVFPVPSSDNVTIRYNASENSEAGVNLFDVAGKLCLSQKVELQKGVVDYPLNISELPRGVYLLQFNNNGKTLVNKIIKE